MKIFAQIMDPLKAEVTIPDVGEIHTGYYETATSPMPRGYVERWKVWVYVPELGTVDLIGEVPRLYLLDRLSDKLKSMNDALQAKGDIDKNSSMYKIILLGVALREKLIEQGAR